MNRKRKTNKKTIDILINCLLVIVIIIMFIVYLQGTEYTKTMKVIESDNTQTIVKDELTDNVFYLDDTNKNKNDKCKVTFNDNNTDNIFDDIIIKVEWIN